MRVLTIGLTALAFLAAAPAKQTFTGRITDNMCAHADHSGMRMGEDDAECTIACVRAHGALYVLWDGKKGYELADQDAPEKFAGKKVKITGTMTADGKLTVSEINVTK